ncbi:MAG: hypothetical protein JNL69_03460 [Bacteroidia bacterium]|nr:hypothetical protein [Bacteroidia bacterium]
MKLKFLALIVLLASKSIIAQPFADILSFGYQTFNGAYKDSSNWKNKTDNYVLNFFLPKEFKNGTTLLVRLNTETINSTISPDSSYSSRLSAISLPVGVKLVTKNKKWESIVLVIPKIASDFKDAINSYDYQYGGIFLQHYVPNNKVKVKAGLYYNREAFGDFFVPLLGVDWKVNDRIYMYGILPTNYKIEFNILKNKLYTGVNLKFFTRSFRLAQSYNNDYVRYDEAQIKLCLDYFVVPKVLIFAEAGYTFGKNPWQYKYNTNDNYYKSNPVYGPMANYPIFNFGLAYRIRFDLEKNEPTTQP